MDLDSHVLEPVHVRLPRTGGRSLAAGLDAATTATAAGTRKPAAGVVEDFVLVERGRGGCRAGVFRGLFVYTIVLPPLPASRAAAPPLLLLPLAPGVGGVVVVRRARFLRGAVLAGGARVHRLELFGVLVEVGVVTVGIGAAGCRCGFPEQTGPRRMVAFAVVAWATGGGTAGLGRRASSTYAGLLLGDGFEIERFRAEGFGGRGVGDCGCSR